MESRVTNTSVSGCISTEDASVLADDNEFSVAAASGLVIWFIGILLWELQQQNTHQTSYLQPDMTEEFDYYSFII